MAPSCSRADGPHTPAANHVSARRADDAHAVARDDVSRPVVCCVSGREEAFRLIPFAVAFAQPLAVPVTAVHAAGADEGREDPFGGARMQGHPVGWNVDVGRPAPTLIAAAEQERAELMVVGVGGHMASTRPLGAVAGELVLRAGCPVLVVPRAASAAGHGWTTQLVVCAFDGSVEARPALGLAAALADRIGVQAFVAHVSCGAVGDLDARVRGDRSAVIVAATCGAKGWNAALPASPAARLATRGSSPVLFVPPEYRRAA